MPTWPKLSTLRQLADVTQGSQVPHPAPGGWGTLSLSTYSLGCFPMYSSWSAARKRCCAAMLGSPLSCPSGHRPVSASRRSTSSMPKPNSAANSSRVAMPRMLAPLVIPRPQTAGPWKSNGSTRTYSNSATRAPSRAGTSTPVTRAQSRFRLVWSGNLMVRNGRTGERWRGPLGSCWCICRWSAGCRRWGRGWTPQTSPVVDRESRRRGRTQK